jgi:hypothetical protein
MWKIDGGDPDNVTIGLSIGDKLVAHCRGCAHKKHFCMYIIVSNATKHQNCDEDFTDRLLSPPKTTKGAPAISNTWHRPFIGRRPASVRAYTKATFRARCRGEASKIFTFLAALEDRRQISLRNMPTSMEMSPRPRRFPAVAFVPAFLFLGSRKPG